MLKVAIACQGGGSHAAFAAGLLHALLTDPDPAHAFELKGISGTSGGAMCAALVWAGFVAAGREDADRRLMGFWETLKANDPPDFWANAVSQMFAALPFTFEVSPYRVPAPAAAIMRGWLKDHLRLEALPPPRPDEPELLVGATDVLSGDRVVIAGREVNYDALIASAAVPFLYEAVPFQQWMLWDGLFSVNPPIRDLVKLDIDELWVIQINPQRSPLPRLTAEIIDRRNELSGNIAMAQELHFVDKINRLIAENAFTPEAMASGNFRTVQIRLVESGLTDKSYASKLNRAPYFIDELLKKGAAAAGAFFDDGSLWPRPDAVKGKAVRIG
ncbi:patatin-like phospholipase family protein [Xanthobacter sp. KR7-65]|uniref:patatin-like phospholipase family protein n=1 Tax=Xanthobacter sp. KR7-65 TaxID=3156612 RepID=UPI0032B450AC